jgi:hypothetical protein
MVDALSAHSRPHSGGSMFSCMHDNCDEEFDTQLKLETHIETEHDGDDGIGDC